MTQRFQPSLFTICSLAACVLMLLAAAGTTGCKPATQPTNRALNAKTATPASEKAALAKHCRDQVNRTASQVCPLMPGQTVPSAKIRTIDGQVTDLAVVVKTKPTLLLIYRGGW